MFDLHDFRRNILSLQPMVVRSCKYPRVGVQIELPGIYAACALNPLDVTQYAKMLRLKDLVREHLFESKSPSEDSLLGQYWSGAKYGRSVYQNEIPRVDAICDFGVRYYTFASGPQMVKNSGFDSELKDRLIFKVFNAPGHWLLEIEAFSQFLQERGLAVPHERNAAAFISISAKQRLIDLLHRVEPSIVMALQRSADVYLAKPEALELLSWVDKDNLQILMDFSVCLSMPAEELALSIAPAIESNPQLRQISKWAIRSLPVADESAESPFEPESLLQPLAA